MNSKHRFELVTCLVLGLLPGCATAMDADLSSGQSSDGGGSVGGGASGGDPAAVAGAGATGSLPVGTSGASTGGTPDSGGGSADAGAGDTASGGAGDSAGAPAGGAAHGGSSGVAGSANGGGGSGTGGSPSGLGPWTFDSSAQGWAVRDHSSTISTMPTVTAGVVTFTGLPFSGASQYTDFAFSFSPTADLTGHTLHAKLRRVSGGFIGVQVYAYGGAWVGSAFASLTSATFIDVALPITASSGFTPAKITRIGIKFNTGSSTTNKFSDTTLEVDSVTIE